MTADAPARRPPDPVNAAPTQAEQERQQARRLGAWSIAWTLLTLVIWGWFAFLTLADYGPESGDRPMCRGLLVGPLSEDILCRDPLRQWPALLGILALAVMVTASAAATTVYAKVLSRLARRDWPGVPGAGLTADGRCSHPRDRPTERLSRPR
ncbi:hypothetical protein [Streptomyces sp. NBC_01240]|uniref:hypothetical protein n=1 Tax=Streptomyces sp. NBC_01240 TaxID=2903793 RepID=UPI002E0D4E45|nr:hypothetical protein OG466_37105 [Streptomyces sp. NBC_01240]